METHTFRVSPLHQGERLDRYLTIVCPHISRSRIQQLMETGQVMLNGLPVSTRSHKVKAGDSISLAIPPPIPLKLQPVSMELEIIHEDEHIAVINKPAGLVVHPGAGQEADTLVHGLLHHCTDLSGIGGTVRPGIVHRLDKDTSGLMVIAKNDHSHNALMAQFKGRLVQKTYLALVKGEMRDLSGIIQTQLGRHPVHRKKMAVVTNGRQAVTEWKRLRHHQTASLVSVRLHTGRTHQIRVHMAHIGHPLLGDSLYGGPMTIHINGEEIKVVRHALHSYRLRILHPVSQQPMEWTVEPPEDMRELISILFGK